MVWVGGLVVSTHVATSTGVRRIVIIAVVAFRTAQRCVSAVQGIVVVVNGEVGRLPVRVCSMAALAICGNVQGYVVWIGGLVIVRHVAALAGIRRVVVIAVVAIYAIYGSVRARQRIVIVMVKV